MDTPSFFNRAFAFGFALPKFQGEKKYFPNTNCIVLNGKWLLNEIVVQCQNLFSARDYKKPHLAVILVGDDPASQVYVKNKIKTFDRAGFSSQLIHIKESDADLNHITTRIEALNLDHACDGILVQLPLPKKLNSQSVFRLIKRSKDVDGFSPENLGLLALDNSDAICACTPLGIMMLLSAYGIQLAGKSCVIVGRSAIVGKPVGLLLLNANATVTFTHSHSENLSFYTRQADILIVAAGKPHLIDIEHVKHGAVVIDVGIHKNSDGTLTGDVHPNVRSVASALTPVPGGVGPTTISGLLINTAISSIQRNMSHI